MGPPRKTIIICIVLLAVYRKTHARTVKKALYNNPSQRNVLPALSSKLHPDDTLQGTTSCVHVGLRNMICVYNEGRLTDVPLFDEQLLDEQFNFWPNIDDEPEEQEFVDLTRVETVHNVGRSKYDVDGSFSEDYLDVGDLSITRKVDAKGLFNPRRYKELTIVLTIPKRDRKPGRRIFSLPDARILNFFSRKPSSNDNDDKDNTSAEEEDSSDDDDSKPKRFEVIEHSESSEESEEPERKPKRVPKKVEQKLQNGKSNYMYMQAPTRLLGPDRRRLPHFLPKQHHWNKDDMHKLPYLWFHGPQGKYSGIYRKPF